MRHIVLLLSCLLLLSSCKLFKSEEYMPEYLKEDSPLDPPGTAAARAELRAKYLKEGMFSKGAKPEVNGGKILMCSRNPEREADCSARMVSTNTVTIIACEGAYYFAEAEGGQRGYIKETDLLDPNGLPMLPEGQDPLGPLMPGDDTLLPGGGEDDTPAVELGENQKLMRDADGRNVIVTDKQTSRSKEFQEREKALQGGRQMKKGSGAVDDDFEPLPEPAQ